MEEHPNAALVRAGMEAFNRGDREAFAEALHEEIVWHAPGNNRFAGESRGKAASLGRFKELMEAGVEFGFTDLHDIVANDDHVVALLTLRVKGPGGEHSGRSVFVYHVRDGKASEFWGMNEDQAAIDRVIDG